MSEIRRIQLQANGLSFQALEAGEGPLVLCMHGFPDTPMSFVPQIEGLVAAGYRVVAPYMRGFTPASIPADGCYQAAALGRDVLGLIDALDADSAVAVGHDWGSMAVTMAALTAPSRIGRLVTIGVPYSPRFLTAMLYDYGQQKRFWYQFLFQLPMAEAAVSHDDFAFIRGLWRDWSPGWEPPAELMAHAIECLGQPGVLAAALAYYRFVYHPELQRRDLSNDQNRYGVEPVAVPALYIHGERDGCIGVEMADGMETMCSGGFERLIVPDAGHFVHRERPDLVHRAILDFLAG